MLACHLVTWHVSACSCKLTQDVEYLLRTLVVAHCQMHMHAVLHRPFKVGSLGGLSTSLKWKRAVEVAIKVRDCSFCCEAYLRGPSDPSSAVLCCFSSHEHPSSCACMAGQRLTSILSNTGGGPVAWPQPAPAAHGARAEAQIQLSHTPVGHRRWCVLAWSRERAGGVG